MKTVTGTIELLDPMKLVPNPNNAKSHTKKQIDVLARSMEKVGFNDPIAITEDNMILAGHGRLQAAKKLGLIKVPVIRVAGLSEEQKRAYTLSHNQIGFMTGWDEEMLKFEIESLKDVGFELDLLGFEAAELDKLLALEEDPADPLGDAPDRLPGVVTLSRSMKLDESELVRPYEIPRLREDRLGDAPEAYTVWIGRNRTTDPGGPLFYLYGSDSTVGLDSSRTTIAFYVDDIRFERVWTALPEWTTKFLTAGVRTLIMPNYSILDGMPTAEAIYQSYRCKYVARYWQEAGLNVIPDLYLSTVPFDVEYFLAGIPVGAPVVAMQMHTFGNRAAEIKEEIRAGAMIALDLLKPQKLLVYGGEPGLLLGKEVAERAGIGFVGVLNRAAYMRADVAKHEETRSF